MKKNDVIPDIILRFSRYQRVILNRSPLTISQYQTDLMMFFCFEYAYKNGLDYRKIDVTELDISQMSDEFAISIRQSDIMEFLMFIADERDNGAKARSRKLTCIRTFYKYIINQEHLIKENPAVLIDSPQIKPALPKFLEEDECLKLLDTVLSDTETKTKERDFAIITLFLNCGMRLSELVGINLSDIDGDMKSVRVMGKGAKQRIIYLNDACRSALYNYLVIRNSDKQIKYGNTGALFLSSRHQRISNKTVQFMVYHYLDMAGFGNRGLSVHKLRHTAATLMYRTGKVDLRVLKDILGHEQLTTTQIYTHVSDENMEKAMDANPLSKIKVGEDK